MALQVPFVRWDYGRDPCDFSQHGCFYYVITAAGLRDNVGRSIHRGTGHFIYKRDLNFVQTYGDDLPLGVINEWDIASEFFTWNMNSFESILDIVFNIQICLPFKQRLSISACNPNKIYNVYCTSMKPMTVSLWDQFSEIEAAAMKNLPGAFPVAIGMRLKRADYYGVGLATRNSTIFIFNPPIPEATALQQWCLANASKIKEISLASPPKMALLKYNEPTPDQIIKIVNLPSKVAKPEYPSIEGIIEVTDFNQKFHYLACTKCNRTTDAYGEEEFHCNHCGEDVKAHAKIIFQVKITDGTDSIQATIFAPPAEELFQITPAEIIEGTLDGHLSMPLLEKLSMTHYCSFHLKAYMYDYGGIEECKFNIQALFPKPTTETQASAEKLLLMAPETPNKKAKVTSYTAQQSSKASAPENPNNNNDMDEESEGETLKRSKKEN